MRPTKSRSAIHNHFVGRPLVAVSFARISSVVYCVTRHITKITGLQESNSHNFTRKNSLTLSWIITSFEFSKNSEETWVKYLKQVTIGNEAARYVTFCCLIFSLLNWSGVGWPTNIHWYRVGEAPHPWAVQCDPREKDWGGTSLLHGHYP